MISLWPFSRLLVIYGLLLVIEASILIFLITVLLQGDLMLQLWLAIVLFARIEMINVLVVLLVEETVVLSVVQILLGRFVRAAALAQLINAELGHLTLCLSSRGFLFLLLFLSFLGDLGLLEFFEHVLVMEDRVGKFVLKGLTFEELLDSRLDLGHFEDLVNGGSHSGVFLKHAGNQLRRCVSKI